MSMLGMDVVKMVVAPPKARVRVRVVAHPREIVA